MKYYELHDFFYERLDKKKRAAWNKDITLDNFYNFPLKNCLVKLLKQHKITSALELGCGTGPISCFLSKKGVKTTGLDISSKAIEMAKKIAKLKNCNVNYIVGDICNFKSTKKFDLIVDGYTLHCIVFDNDRRRAFKSIYNHLKKDHFFIVETMVYTGDKSFSNDARFYFDEQYILWSTGMPEWNVEWKTINGVNYFPHRRILPKENINEELKKAHFDIVETDTIKQKDGGPLLYRVLCRK